ncbi:MAG: cobalt-zinc-cadmium efflux system membrane fusion protein, partial [Cognaticolwellia sp.]
MRSTFKILTLIVTLCFVGLSASFSSFAVSEQKVEESEPEKGPNRGRMLRKGDFA